MSAVDEALVEVLRKHAYAGALTPRATCDCNWKGQTGYPSVSESYEYAEHLAAALAPVLAAQRAAALRDFADAMEVQTEHPASGQCKGCDGLRYAARIARERADRIEAGQ